MYLLTRIPTVWKPWASRIGIGLRRFGSIHKTVENGTGYISLTATNLLAQKNETRKSSSPEIKDFITTQNYYNCYYTMNIITVATRTIRTDSIYIYDALEAANTKQNLHSWCTLCYNQWGSSTKYELYKTKKWYKDHWNTNYCTVLNESIEKHKREREKKAKEIHKLHSSIYK